ncbi:MAG: hypothetical protein RLZZ367_483 [Bacteroidota bacterium]|jgi:hypothetical protein
MQNNIQLLKPRDLGQVIRDSFGFLKLTFKPFSTVLLLGVLPFILLGGYLYSSFIFNTLSNLPGLNEGYVTRTPSGLVSRVLPAVLALMLGTVVLYLASIETFFKYEKSETGTITSADIFDGIKSDLLRFISFIILAILISVLSLIVISIAMGLLVSLASMASTVVGGILGIVFFCGFIYLGLAFIFTPVIFLRERCDLITAFSRSFLLIKGHWWQTFGILFVMYIVIYLMMLVLALPFYIFVFASAFSGIKTGNALPQIGNWGAVYLTFLFCFTTLVSSVFHNAVMLQYYSLTEQKYGENVMQRIQNMNQLDSESFKA